VGRVKRRAPGASGGVRARARSPYGTVPVAASVESRTPAALPCPHWAMRPADDPRFFRSSPPDGRSRESTIRLDAQGRFWHDEALVQHRGLVAALHAWIGRHPENGRYILCNGYDWTYFTVDDAPFSVELVRIEPERIVLLLSDGTEESWRPEATRLAADGSIYATVKPDAPGGPYEARFTRHAQLSLAPALVEGADDEAAPAVNVSGRIVRIGAACSQSPGPGAE